MDDIDRVLVRMVTEPDFCRGVATDPVRALAGYRLAAVDRELLWLQACTARWSMPTPASASIMG